MALIRPRAQTASSKPAATRRTTTGSRFNYTPPTAEELRERATRKGSRDSFFASDVQFFTPKVGENNIRILPPPPEKRDEWRSYGVTLYVHYGIGADEAAYLCLDKMKGEACPVCEERSRAKAAGEEELTNDLRATTRIAVYLVDRDQEGKGPLIWNMPQTIDADICGRSVDKKTGEVYAVDDPTAGYDVSFIREGQSMTTKYKSIDIARRSSSLSEDEAVATRWLDHVCANPIDDKLIDYDYAHIKNALFGAATSETQQPETPPPAVVSDKPATPRIPLRGSKIAAKSAAVESTPDKPTYDEVMAMNEDDIGALGEEFKLTFPDDGFAGLDEARTWTVEQLELTPPEPEPTAAPKGWRDRLRSASKAK